MASPFHVFRKHQKILIATLGVLAMIAFVFLPIVMDRMGARSVRNPVVLKTSEYGNIRQRGLENMRNQRLGLVRFLQHVQAAVQQAGGNAQAARQFELLIGPATEQSVVNTWLQVEQAKQLGMVISDQAINELLGELTEGRITAFQLKTIFERMRINQYQFFDSLRYELLALRLRAVFQVSLAAVPPAQRWDYFTRLKQLATVEVLPVAVDKFTADIDDPDDETLQAFFEEHKENFPDPSSPEPGFHRPFEVAVRYFKADYEKFAGPDVVSEDEIKEFYEKYKEVFDRMPSGTVEEPKAESPKETGEQMPKEEPKPTGDKAVDPLPSEPSSGQPPEGSSPEETRPAEKEDAPGKEEASADGPSEATSGDAEKASEPSGSDDTSSARAKSPFMLTAMLQEEGALEPPADEPKAAAAANEKTAPAGKPVPGEANRPPVESQPDEPEAVGSTSEPAASQSGESPEGQGPKPVVQPSEPAPGQPEEPEKKGPKKAEDILSGPVGEMIRRQLASQKIAEVFTLLQDKMQAYRRKHIRYEAGKEAEPPTELDYAALAKEYGVTTGQTPLMSQLEARDYDIGRSFVDDRIPFVGAAYEPDWRTYVIATSVDIEGNRYLFWKTEETKAFIPKLEDADVRKEVLAAWKMVQARSKALEAAQRLATEARKADQSLNEVFAGRPGVTVTETPPFSWMTRGNVPAMASPSPRPRLSEVEGVDRPGPEFMQTVFRMQPGEMGVAMNRPKTVAYVVRVVEDTPTSDALWAQFEKDPYNTYADAADGEQSQMLEAWRAELQSSAGLEWLPRPDRPPVEE